MSHPRYLLLALGVAFAAAIVAGAQAQDAAVQDDRWTLKPLIPPVFLPPNSQVNPGAVGGTVAPSTTAPQNPTQTQTQPAPGIRLSIPSR
jgi:hypothetical protein